MEPIRVAIQGARGKMGQEVIGAVCRAGDMEPVAAIDITGGDFLPRPDGKGRIPFSADPEAILTRTKPQVLVDFSSAEASMSSARIAAGLGVNLVIGTTGLTADNINEIEQLCTRRNIGAVVASNFALGAVIMIHLARTASRFFDYAEIVEMHHENKKDAPSGTALATARAMLEGWYRLTQVLPFVFLVVSILLVVGLVGAGLPLAYAVMLGGILAVVGAVGSEVIVGALVALF